MKIHSSCEIEGFVETHFCKLCVILRSRVVRVVCESSPNAVCRLDYASPATAVRSVSSVRVFQHVTSYTCVQRNPCVHCHHTMRPSSPNSAVPFYRGLSTSILSVTFPALKRKSPTKHSATPDDRQVPSREVKCDKTFSHSRRSPSAFSCSQVL